ncbi:MAG TPA: hypothetical protein VH475_25660 [Tepidisphaeraceae bacterium]|jgi:hypothetical protein
MRPALLFAFALTALSCTAPPPTQPVSAPATQPADSTEPDALQSLHLRLVVNPATGDVTYLGWYDGRRNLLGSGGIVTALVGMEPPELRGELKKLAPNELLFRGIDQNQILWTKRYRLDDRTVFVTHTITNRGDRPFDAILYSLADLPDATIRGDNRDQLITSPLANARFHAEIANPNFPGEQMNPYALRSDTHRLNPGDSMDCHMTWELQVARAARP